MLGDPFELVKKLRPGLMIYGNAKEKMEDEFTFIFLAREDDKYIKKLGDSPIIEVRAGLLSHNNVAAILVMAKINDDDDMMYDVWLNYWANGQGEGKAFDRLQYQDNLVFQFYDSLEIKRSIGIPNKLKGDINQFIEKIKPYPKWTMSEFDALKGYYYNKYPTGQGLWKVLLK